MNSRYSWQWLAFCSLLGFAIAILCFLNMDPLNGIPAESALLQATGKVTWVQEFKYGTRFGLTGTSEKFDYPSKAGTMSVVRNALSNSSHEVVAVRYGTKTHGPMYSGDRYHDVW